MPCGRKSGRGDITSHDSYCCAAPYHSQTGSCRAAPNLNFSFAPFAQVSFVRKENHLRADKNFIPRRGMYICRRGMYICRRGLYSPRRGMKNGGGKKNIFRHARKKEAGQTEHSFPQSGPPFMTARRNGQAPVTGFSAPAQCHSAFQPVRSRPARPRPMCSPPCHSPAAPPS